MFFVYSFILTTDKKIEIEQEETMLIRNPWLRYLGCMFTPGLPSIGSPLRADVIIAQAFGRNSISEAEFGKVVTLFHEQAQGDDIKAFELLRQQGFDAGIANRDLADLCKQLADFYQLPIIGQWEVMAQLYFADQDWYVQNQSLPGRRLVAIWPESPDYFATWHVKSATKAEMERRGWQVPIEVAQKHMIARAYLVLRKLGLDPVIVDQEVGIFDLYSVQPWTRSWLKWYPREFLGRVHHLVFGFVGPLPVRE